MASANILVVEDENIVAKDIENNLKSLGYGVSAVVSSGEEAVKSAEDTHPDLVLMDIVLKGEMDGVQAAGRIYDQLNIPVVYLTAYADEKTLQRATTTEPFGYIVKPFEERELRGSIEVALQRNKTESKLRKKKESLTTILKSIGGAVIATDIRGSVTFMNPLAEVLTGWKQEDALGKDSREVFNIVSEKTGTSIESPATKAIREDAIVEFEHNTLLIAKDGTETPILDSAAPLRDHKGNITGAVLVFRDITKHKKAEEVLIRSEKFEALEEMAGGVAHDFNNLLAIILLNAHLLEKGLKPYKVEEFKKSLERIMQASYEGGETVRKLQYLTEGEVSRGNFTRVDLNEVVRQAIASTSPRWKDEAEAKGATIRIKEELGKLPLALGSAPQLTSVLTHLIFNAVEAMPEGGDITVRTEPKENEVLLYLTDSGKGIPREIKHRIFDPFFTTKGPKASGLGLSVCHAIIDHHQGRIEVESTEGKGATFTIIIPAQPEAPLKKEKLKDL